LTKNIFFRIIQVLNKKLKNYSNVAQSVEQVTVNHPVAGSIPAVGAKEVSSVGRATPLQGEGHRFDPGTSYQIISDNR
jgi:hypothetical protein